LRAALVLAAVLLWPAPASAADLGGGRAPDTVVTLRTGADSVVVRAHLLAGCGAGAVRRRVALAPDGSFSLAARVRGRAPDDGRVRRIARLTVTGRVVGSAATGTARVGLTFRRRGRVVGRCASGERRWRAGTALYGLTSDAAGRPRAFLLERSLRRVTTAVFEYRLRCRGGSASGSTSRREAASRPTARSRCASASRCASPTRGSASRSAYAGASPGPASSVGSGSRAWHARRRAA
jgi:hypothetical protein